LALARYKGKKYVDIILVVSVGGFLALWKMWDRGILPRFLHAFYKINSMSISIIGELILVLGVAIFIKFKYASEFYLTSFKIIQRDKI